MGNEVAAINDAKKDCCNNQDNGISFLSIIESAGKGVSGAVQKAESFGAGVVAGAAAGLGLGISKETAEAVGKAAVIGAIGGAAALGAEQAIKHPGAAAAIGAGAIGGAIGAEVLKGAAKGAGGAIGCAAECAKDAGKDVVKDAAVGALIGGAIGAASGDATRAVTLAAMGAVTGVAARCAAEMCKPCCGVKPAGALDALKDIGKTIMDHVTNRPIEAGAEAVVGGAVGVVGGAMLRKALEEKDCQKLCEKAMKNTCCELQKQAEMMKKVLVDPIVNPVIEIGPGPVDAGKAAKAAIEAAAAITAPGATVIGVEAGKAAAEAVKQTNKELDQHRKDNPTTSKIEQGVGNVIGGPIAGKLVGTAIEVGDIKARQAAKWVQSWFE